MATIGRMVPSNILSKVLDELEAKNIDYGYWDPRQMMDPDYQGDIEITVDNRDDSDIMGELIERFKNERNDKQGTD